MHTLKVILGADHGGYELKEQVKSWLDEWGYAYHDVGAAQLDPSDDYPPYSFKVAAAVAEVSPEIASEEFDTATFSERAVGVLLCRSGGGVCLAANKVDKIRAVQAFTVEQAERGRHHDLANVLTLSGDFTSEEMAQQILKAFLETPWGHEPRRTRRVAQITEYEQRRKK